MRLHLGGHAHARVADHQHHARLRGPGTARLPRHALDVARGDGQDPAPGHGVAGVQRQVEDDLLDLAAVRPDPRARRLRPGLDPDRRTDQPLQDLLHLEDHLVQIEDPELEHLPAAEGQQLLRERGGAARRGAHLADARAPRVLVAQSCQQGLGVAEDDGEQVVEVVRHAARQPADRLELLGLAQLLLEEAALGDVLQRADQAHHRPAGIALRVHRRAHHADAAIRPDDAVLDLPFDGTPFDRVPHPPLDRRAVLGMQAFGVLGVVHHPRAVRHAEDAGGPRRPPPGAGREVHLPGPGPGQLLRADQVALALGQPLLHPLPLGEVDRERDAEPLLAADEGGARQHRYAAAVLPDELGLEGQAHAGRVRLPDRLRHPVPVLGRRDGVPAQPPRQQVVPVHPQQPQEVVVGVHHLPAVQAEEDAYHVRLDHAAEALLALAQGPLGLHPLRDVAHDADHAPVRQGARAGLGGERGPVPAPDRAFVQHGLAPRHGFDPQRVPPQFVGNQELGGLPAHELVPAPADQLAQPGVHLEQDRVHAHDPDPVRGLLHEPPVAGLALAQGMLHASALGDVAHDTHHAPVRQTAGADLRREDRAVGAPQGPGGEDRAAALQLGVVQRVGG